MHAYIIRGVIIPFPHKGNGILFLCGFIFPIIIIVVVVVVKIPSFFKISQWNLVGTWVMGLIAYIMMYDRIFHAVMEFIGFIAVAVIWRSVICVILGNETEKWNGFI